MGRLIERNGVRVRVHRLHFSVAFHSSIGSISTTPSVVGAGGDKEWMLMDNSLPALLVCPLSICMTTHNEKKDGSLTEVSDYFVLEEKKISMRGMNVQVYTHFFFKVSLQFRWITCLTVGLGRH